MKHNGYTVASTRRNHIHNQLQPCLTLVGICTTRHVWKWFCAELACFKLYLTGLIRDWLQPWYVACNCKQDLKLCHLELTFQSYLFFNKLCKVFKLTMMLARNAKICKVLKQFNRITAFITITVIWLHSPLGIIKILTVPLLSSILLINLVL